MFSKLEIVKFRNEGCSQLDAKEAHFEILQFLRENQGQSDARKFLLLSNF